MIRLTSKEARKHGIFAIPKKGGKGKRAGKRVMTDEQKLFDRMCVEHGLPIPVHEYEFHPTRKWRFDHLFDGWLALEVDGGAWSQGRHVQGQGFLNDREKDNEAHILGYMVLHCTPQEVESGAAFALVRRGLEAKEEMP